MGWGDISIHSINKNEQKSPKDILMGNSTDVEYVIREVMRFKYIL